MKLEDEGDVGTDASVQISTNVISVIYPSSGVLSAVFWQNYLTRLTISLDANLREIL